jgi:hypothetical protein
LCSIAGFSTGFSTGLLVIQYCVVLCSIAGYSTGFLVPSVANVPFILLLIFSNNLL